MSSDSATLACTYAALMLHEGGAPMTAENIAAAVAAAGVEVRPTLPIIFARFLQKKSISELMNAASAQAAATAAAAAPASAGGAAPAAAAGGKKEAKKVESESDDDGVGFGLFD